MALLFSTSHKLGQKLRTMQAMTQNQKPQKSYKTITLYTITHQNAQAYIYMGHVTDRDSALVNPLR